MSAYRSRSVKLDFTRPFKRPVLLFLVLFLSVPVLLFTGINARAAQVTLSWTDADPDVTGYKLYYGTVSGSYTYCVNVGDTKSYALSGLSTGATYYFAATAYDSAGYESGYSNQVGYTVPSACAYSISPRVEYLSASGVTGSISVTTPSGCAWTASSAASWVSITSGSSGTGSGIVKYSVAANTGASSRMEASTIAGLSFTVFQAAAATNYH
jgi:hypothetical protein